MEKENNNNQTKKPSKNVRLRSSKKNGPLNMIKAALYMLRNQSNKKSNSVPVDVASKGLWKTLVSSMRPLHQIEHRQSPPHPKTTITTTTQTVDSFVDVLPPPISPMGSVSPSSSSTYSISQFASAQNLQELDSSEGCHDGDDNGDKMIDTRAEEFIAHFYEQMRLQRLESFNYYNEMVERGLR